MPLTPSENHNDAAPRGAHPVWVVIPTYNERDNLAPLVSALLAVRPSLQVVVVDDASPDGTGEAAAEMARHSPQVHVIQRGGRYGYSSAVREGLRHALQQGAALLVHMDADFSHDPGYLPRLLELAESEVDVAVGSRYVPGGGTRNWTLFRRLLSAAANLLVRLLLRLPARDCTGGFRCYRRHVVERSDLLRTQTEGYAFLLATMYSLHREGWRIGETPIVFVDRQWGRSKLSKRIILESALVALRLLLRRLGMCSEGPPDPVLSADREDRRNAPATSLELKSRTE